MINERIQWAKYWLGEQVDWDDSMGKQSSFQRQKQLPLRSINPGSLPGMRQCVCVCVPAVVVLAINCQLSRVDGSLSVGTP